MNKIVGVAASLLVNLTMVLAFEQSANDAAAAPDGQVIISYATEQPVTTIASVPSLGGELSARAL